MRRRGYLKTSTGRAKSKRPAVEATQILSLFSPDVSPFRHPLRRLRVEIRQISTASPKTLPQHQVGRKLNRPRILLKVVVVLIPQVVTRLQCSRYLSDYLRPALKSPLWMILKGARGKIPPKGYPP